MNAISSRFPILDSAAADPGVAREAAMALKWEALHDAAETIAELAGIESSALDDGAPGRFIAAVAHTDAPRMIAVEQAVADLFAVMQPGIAALLAITVRGGDPQVAAQALWDEFATARTALLALVEPQGRA